jgi:hypothetical protein
METEKGPTGREAQRLLTAELLSAFRAQAQTTTEFMERFAGQTINHVLEVYSGAFDTTGVFTRDYNVAAGSIEVTNLGVAANLITVSSSGPGSGTPTGTGTYLIAGGTTKTVALASRAFTLYGTAADRFCVQVFTSGVRPVTA